MPSHIHSFDIMNVTMGVGVGASVGTIGVVIFDARQLSALNGKDVGKGDVSLNASVGARWGDVAKVLSKYEIYAKMAKIGKLMKAKKVAAGPGELTDLVEALMTLRKAATLDPHGKKPVFFTFPIPGAGTGLRLSINYTLQGKFELGRLKVVE